MEKLEAFKNTEKATSATSTEFESFSPSVSIPDSTNRISTGTSTPSDKVQKKEPDYAEVIPKRLEKKSTGTSPPPQEISTQVNTTFLSTQ